MLEQQPLSPQSMLQSLEPSGTPDLKGLSLHRYSDVFGYGHCFFNNENKLLNRISWQHSSTDLTCMGLESPQPGINSELELEDAKNSVCLEPEIEGAAHGNDAADVVNTSEANLIFPELSMEDFSHDFSRAIDLDYQENEQVRVSSPRNLAVEGHNLEIHQFKIGNLNQRDQMSLDLHDTLKEKKNVDNIRGSKLDSVFLSRNEGSKKSISDQQSFLLELQGSPRLNNDQSFYGPRGQNSFVCKDRPGCFNKGKTEENAFDVNTSVLGSLIKMSLKGPTTESSRCNNESGRNKEEMVTSGIDNDMKDSIISNECRMLAPEVDQSFLINLSPEVVELAPNQSFYGCDTHSNTKEEKKSCGSTEEERFSGEVQARFLELVQKVTYLKKNPDLKSSGFISSPAGRWKTMGNQTTLELQRKVEELKALLVKERCQRQVIAQKLREQRQGAIKILQQKQDLWEKRVRELQKEKYSLSIRLQRLEVECPRRQISHGDTVQLTEEEVRKLRQEIIDQESLIKGYQVENEKAVQKLREIQAESKEREDLMTNENACLASQLADMKVSAQQSVNNGTAYATLKENMDLKDQLQNAQANVKTLMFELEKLKKENEDLETKILKLDKTKQAEREVQVVEYSLKGETGYACVTKQDCRLQEKSVKPHILGQGQTTKNNLVKELKHTKERLTMLEDILVCKNATIKNLEQRLESFEIERGKPLQDIVQNKENYKKIPLVHVKHGKNSIAGRNKNCQSLDNSQKNITGAVPVLNPSKVEETLKLGSDAIIVVEKSHEHRMEEMSCEMSKTACIEATGKGLCLQPQWQATQQNNGAFEAGSQKLFEHPGL